MQITLIFLAILACVASAIRPFKVGRRDVSFGVVSLILLALFFVVGIVTPSSVIGGLLSNGHFEPWKIILIFFTVAYVSISTDATGIFDHIAFRIIQAVKGNGFKLFFAFYLFGALLTLFTSNDIVILTLTPVIFYLSRHAKINIIPLLFAEFFVANTASMFLFVGDPTNIILGSALGVGFLEFSLSTFIPGIVALIANFLLLYLVFRKQIHAPFSLKKHTSSNVRSWPDAIFSFSLLLLMLLTLVASDFLGLPIWAITTAFALIFILDDVFMGLYFAWNKKECSRIQLHKHRSICKHLPDDPHDLLIVFRRMPWQILPFIVTMFVFVQRLTELGFVDRVAGWIIDLTHPILMLGASGVSALLLSNIMNNQPTAIFFANVFSTDMMQTLPYIQDFIYPVVIATSLGANVTLIGALAGLMWRDILAKKGVHISYTDFLRRGIIITPITFTVSILAFLLIF